MNPRVSRSSALASKATGFPIARVAAKLAVGYTLDELDNEITGGATPASFEPTIDYIVTKIPRFTFEKFPQADPQLTTQMKSVGEVMAIGRTFQESLQKALRGLETGVDGFINLYEEVSDATTWITSPTNCATRVRNGYCTSAKRFATAWTWRGYIHCPISIPGSWRKFRTWLRKKNACRGSPLGEIGREHLYRLKQKGFSDSRLAALLDVKETEFRQRRHEMGIRPVYKRVDSCAAEFPATTAYMYSTYDEECEAEPTTRDKIMVLGGGPNRIGQGIEFDYCCVQAAFAIRDAGLESIMVNCNPETVSTDYDTSDRLYFEPLTLEDVLEIIHLEQPRGVIVQFGGQTPLKLARALEAEGAPIIGTSPDSIDLAEDRERFQRLLQDLDLKQPSNRTVRNLPDAIRQAQEIGYPIVVRPSYVLGGRAMEIVYDETDLNEYMSRAVAVSNDSPVLLDRFLDNAIEVDVDAISDGNEVIIGGIMEHIEQAGIHSGDSACSLPPFSLSEALQQRLAVQVEKMARSLKVSGLMNTQFAIQGEDIFVLEVNPRASRTVPYVSKATGVPLARIAARCMVGESLAEQGIRTVDRPEYYSIKEAVFPFVKFPGVDPILGPEMKSTGEVMGVGSSFGEAYNKAVLATSQEIPGRGVVFISVRDKDKPDAVQVARDFVEAGFSLCATEGTARIIGSAGVECNRVNKVAEGHPHVVDMLKNDEISLIVNTTEGRQAIMDSDSIRTTAIQHKVFYTTTIAGAKAIISALRENHIDSIRCLQELHEPVT